MWTERTGECELVSMVYVFLLVSLDKVKICCIPCHYVLCWCAVLQTSLLIHNTHTSTTVAILSETMVLYLCLNICFTCEIISCSIILYKLKPM